MKSTSVFAAGLLLLASGAMAQDQSRVRGTIASLDGSALRVETAGGREVAITLSPDFTVTGLVPANLADIKPGSFIGTAADTQPDGTLVAKEVHIFPDAMRGAGEGHRAFDLGPKSTMTNGTVGQEVKAASGSTLTVGYKGGEKVIAVPPGAPVVMFAPGSRAMLTAGAHVVVQARGTTGGTLTADRVTVGENGLVPPM